MKYPVISGLIQYTANIAVHLFEIAMHYLGEFGIYLRVSVLLPPPTKTRAIIFHKLIVSFEPHDWLEALHLLYPIATRLLSRSLTPAPAPQCIWASRSLALFKVITGAKIDRPYARLIISWLPVGASSHLELRTCYRQRQISYTVLALADNVRDPGNVVSISYDGGCYGSSHPVLIWC
ncbi:hypothetical protein BU17DRAFT_94397 [Hysterangium stoloniferum]|nr:hypothetical protein BU17DRAFT_94397 [Hysterangium stoloniferum]